MTKSRKVAILATSRLSATSGQEGRVGPPESVRKDRKAGKAGKGAIWPFLRVPRAIGRPWGHSGPRAPSKQSSEPGDIASPGPPPLCGLPGLLEPWKSNRHLYGASVVRAFPGPSHAGSRGLLEPSGRSRTLDGSSVSLGFPAQGPGHLSKLRYPATYASGVPSKLGTLLDSSAGPWRDPPLCAHLERHGSASRP